MFCSNSRKDKLENGSKLIDHCQSNPPMFKELFASKLMGRDLAIALGTSKTIVYRRTSGVILNAPSVLAINKKDGRILAVGLKAK